MAERADLVFEGGGVNDTFARTIPIPTLGVGTTEFDISPERVRALYDSGHQAAGNFLEHWNPASYVERFPRGAAPSRRAALLE